MRGRLLFLLTVILPGLGLVLLSGHSIREEQRLLEQQRAARASALGGTVRDAFRAGLLKRVEALDERLRRVVKGGQDLQDWLIPGSPALLVDGELELVVPATPWVKGFQDLPPSPAALLKSQLLVRQDRLEDAIAVDRALAGDESAPSRFRRIAYQRQVAALQRRPGRGAQVRDTVEDALAFLVASEGKGETPGAYWFALHTLLEQARQLGAKLPAQRGQARTVWNDAPPPLRVHELELLARHAAQVGALADLDQLRQQEALDPRFRITPSGDGGWLVIGPPLRTGAQTLRVVLPLSQDELRAGVLAYARRQLGHEEFDIALTRDPGVEVALGLSIQVTPRQTAVGQQLARRRAQQRLAVLAGLVLLVLLGAFFTWRSVSRTAELSRMRADFVASVTHELRTPLASIRTMADVLALGKVEEEADRQEFFQAMASETKRLSRMVDDVLDMSRIERGAFTAELEPGRVEPSITSAVDAVRAYAEEEGYALTCQLPDSPLPPVLIDAALFPRALENLLVNAVKYSGGGKQITVTAAASHGRVRVDVADAGTGIPPAERGRIFERFVRGGATRGKTGTGLGLAIVREIMRAHGGEVTLESDDAGSTFVLYLNAWEPEEDEA